MKCIHLNDEKIILYIIIFKNDNMKALLKTDYEFEKVSQILENNYPEILNLFKVMIIPSNMMNLMHL